MSRQRAHWAITVREENFNTWDIQKQNEFTSVAGKYIDLKGDRISMIYSDALNYKLAVGFKEKEDSNTAGVHWHCLFSCDPGKTCTAGRVRIVMKSHGMPIVNEYLQCIDTNPLVFMKYANKEGVRGNIKKSSVDDILRIEFQKLKEKSSVSREMFNSLLCEKYGATWLTKNKSVIDTFCSIQEECYAERIIVDDEDTEIEERVKNIIESFYSNILYQITQSGSFVTRCDALVDVKNEHIAKYITFVAFIPYLFQRATKVIDFIPGLYFWGDANAGKSFVFQLGRSYRPIAMDSNGVGKFKLETCESAFLLDDVKGDFVDTSLMSSTLRQLTLGAYTRVKVHSETRQTKGFVAVTSNEKPNFLDSAYDEKNRIAWLRRFIVVEFRNNDNLNDIVINGNELEFKVSQTAIAPTLLAYAQEFKENYNIEHRINKSLELYVKHLSKYISTSTTIVEDGSNLDNIVGYIDKAKELKRKLEYFQEESEDDDDGHDISSRARKKLEFTEASDDAFMR